jgi:hypothetical protein
MNINFLLDDDDDDDDRSKWVNVAWRNSAQFQNEHLSGLRVSFSSITLTFILMGLVDVSMAHRPKGWPNMESPSAFPFIIHFTTYYTTET